MTAHNITNLPVVQPPPDASEIMEAVILAGDLSKLSPAERTQYFMKTCSSLGLNPLTKPFDYIRLSGREVLYATKGCADQLRSNRRISLEITDRKITNDLFVVTVRAVAPDGRSDEDMAAVSIKGLAGEALSNAMMKATTKAKRRVTLSICGLGMLDETEVRSVLEAEAQEGGTAKPLMLKAPTPPPPPRPAAKPVIKVKVPGQPAAEFAQDVSLEAALVAALAFMSDAILDGRTDVVEANNPLLDRIAEKLPEMADAVAELRAAAVMALGMTSDQAELGRSDEPEPEPESDGFVARFVAGDDDTFPGDLPSKAN
jgi:hypothetical protein